MIRQDKVNEMNEDWDKLRDDLKQANYRNDGLQHELQAGAKKFGQQIADLKIQVRKLKNGDNEDDDDLVSNLSDGTAAELSQLSEMLDSVSMTNDSVTDR